METLMPATSLQRLPILGQNRTSSPAADGPSLRAPAPPPPPGSPEVALRLERIIAHRVGQAIRDFAMIEPGDRVMVAVSGGKDSYTLLRILEGMRRRAPIHFELVAVNVDQSYAGYRQDVLAGWLRASGF